MLKSKLIAAALMLSAFGASAELVTPTQTASFNGSAGNDSSEVGVDPFVFNKFDTTLGTLTGMYLQYDFSVFGGLIGADNMTNTEASGTGELGGGIVFQDTFSIALDALLGNHELSEMASFTLAADPTMSTGGTGPDVATLTGSMKSDGRAWQALHLAFLTEFESAVGDTTFTIDFNTHSITEVNVPGAQGFFQAEDMSINMEVYYTYEEFQVQEPTNVSAPLMAFAGLAMLGMAGVRRKKQ